MSRKALAALVVLVAAALAVAASALGRTSKTPTLHGVVGPGYSVSLTMNGKKVKSLKAGKYKFAVTDKSSFHNFKVEWEKGGRFAKLVTSTPSTGPKSAVITLKPGSWRYYCSVHESQMHGDFTVKK
jgi:plastocyanin